MLARHYRIVGRVETVQETRATGADSRGSLALAISAGLALMGVISFVLALSR